MLKPLPQLRVVSEEFIRFEDISVLSVIAKYLPCLTSDRNISTFPR